MKLIQPLRLALTLVIGLAIAGLSDHAKGAAMTAYDFSFDSIDGGKLPLEAYKGKVVMVVNTASLCGFTPQYTGLEKLYTAYKDKGLVIVGVPSNDFGGQEPGDAKDIKKFCTTRYDIDFPLADKVDVIGPNAHPFYQWATATLGQGSEPKWNFHKYLIGTDGRLIGYFPSKIEPNSKDITSAIDKALPGS